MHKGSPLAGAAGVALFLAGASGPAAADYPTEPVTLLVGFGAGGGTDAVARKVAELMEPELGQTVVVVNRPGGGGLVSWQELVAAEPDGYTIAMFLPVNAFIQKYLETSEAWIDPLADIRFLGMVNQDAWGIAVRAEAPYDGAPGFVEHSQEQGGVKVSDGGPATAYHWAWVDFAATTGAEITTVTYRGATAEGLKAVAGGEIEAAGAGAPEADSLASAGLIKMLGIAAEERLPAYPDVPTFAEQGIDFVFGITRGFAAPAGIPDEAAAALESAIRAAYESDAYQDFLAQTGHGGLYLAAKDGEAFLEREDERFRRLMRDAGVLRASFE